MGINKLGGSGPPAGSTGASGTLSGVGLKRRPAIKEGVDTPVPFDPKRSAGTKRPAPRSGSLIAEPLPEGRMEKLFPSTAPARWPVPPPAAAASTALGPAKAAPLPVRWQSKFIEDLPDEPHAWHSEETNPMGIAPWNHPAGSIPGDG